MSAIGFGKPEKFYIFKTPDGKVFESTYLEEIQCIVAGFKAAMKSYNIPTDGVDLDIYEEDNC